jgi:predicted DCC family thiol-disulfide oxidoreductase YuxK
MRMSLPHNPMPPVAAAAPAAPNPFDGGRIVILFDGVCDVCHRGVAWVRARDTGGAFAFVPFQDPAVARRRPDLDPAALARAVHVVVPDGRVVTGADALPVVLARLPGRGPRIAARLLALPGALAVARPLYRVAAALRPRRPSSCLTPHDGGD